MMIISIECQHRVRLRWSASHKDYVPMEKGHATHECRPTFVVKDGVRSEVAKKSAQPHLTVVR